MLTAVFVIAKRWKNPIDWINKVWYVHIHIYTMEYYSEEMTLSEYASHKDYMTLFRSSRFIESRMRVVSGGGEIES